MPAGPAWGVAIVGAGPAAFYAAEALRKAAAGAARIDLIERLPTPFGLVRAGVAPDHQNIKAVARMYVATASAEGVRYFGNVGLGRDVQVADLTSRYEQIVYAYGCHGSRRLCVPGEDLAGVRPAAEFVAFYNGDAGRPTAPFALDAIERVVVVGNGNVALDVARLLLSTPERLQATDVVPSALAALASSRVREVTLLGRRSVAEAAYAPKEMEEIAELPNVDVVVTPADARVDDASATWLATSAPRSNQRNVAFAQAQAGRGDGDRPKKLRCRFRVAPAGFVGANGRVTGVQLQPMRLTPGADGEARAVADGPLETIAADLVLVAVGYQGTAMPGVPFDPARGTVRNADGRVLSDAGAPRVGEYAVGWCKNGPVGLIGTNSQDAKEVVARMVEDRAAGRLLRPNGGELLDLLRQRGVDVVDWADWLRLDAWETQQGQAHGAVRRKLGDASAQLAQVRALRAHGR
ncbi:MAG: NADP oxidoreductase [Planctomycetes bacterium]|nr:NADP oxidoreductase [Planctomycetota bacterium]